MFRKQSAHDDSKKVRAVSWERPSNYFSIYDEQWRNDVVDILSCNSPGEFIDRALPVSPKYAQEIKQLAENYAELQLIIAQHLKDKPFMIDMVDLILRDYTLNNSLRQMLFNPEKFQLVMSLLKDIEYECNAYDLDDIEKFLEKFSLKDEILYKENGPHNFQEYRELRAARRPELVTVKIENEDKLSEKQKQIAQHWLAENAPYVPNVKEAIDKIIQKLQEVTISYPPFCDSGLKQLNSIIEKLEYNPDLTLNRLRDILRGRIIVDDNRGISEAMKVVEALLGDKIIMRWNRFVDRPSSPYRAVHYIIRINEDICFELQIKTLNGLIIGEIDHELWYGRRQVPYMFLSERGNFIERLSYGLQYKNAEAYIQSNPRLSEEYHKYCAEQSQRTSD